MMAGREVDVLVVAGGTGGHIYPAVALAEGLQAQGLRVLWIGSTRGLEHEVSAQSGIALQELDFSGIRGRGLGAYLGLPWRLARALGRCMGVLGLRRPRLIVCFGGYITVPMGIAAGLRGIPLWLHEQNAVMGSANRLLQRWASRVFVGFSGTRHARADAQSVGIPIRQPLLDRVAAAEASTSSPPASSPADAASRPTRLLVVGGSLGAVALNRAVPEAMALLGDEAQHLKVWHQTGRQPNADTETLAAYRGTRVGVERVAPYIDSMGEAYAWADLAVARAGAATVAELQALRLPAILVPLPNAIDNHQVANAQALVADGLGVCVEQGDGFVPRLADALRQMALPTHGSQPRGPAQRQSKATQTMVREVLAALAAPSPTPRPEGRWS